MSVEYIQTFSGRSDYRVRIYSLPLGRSYSIMPTSGIIIFDDDGLGTFYVNKPDSSFYLIIVTVSSNESGCSDPSGTLIINEYQR